MQDLTEITQQLGQTLLQRGQTVAVAESCTGGWIAKCLTDIAGSSRWFDRGLVTYTNDAKVEMLGVEPATLGQHGAVSAATVEAMTDGLLQRCPATWAVAVSGIAGPDGGSADKPVGTVWISWQSRGQSAQSRLFRFSGDRDSVRRQAVAHALSGLQGRLG